MFKDKIISLLRDFRNYGLFNFRRRIDNIRRGYRHSLKVFWYPDIDNFGDIITPLLLSANKIVPILVPRKNAELVCCGSILGGVPSDYNGVIFGSGFIQSVSQSWRFPNAKVFAVRGKLTREILALPETVPLGDPGLLLRKYYKERQKKKFVLGLIPHYVDKHSRFITDIARRESARVKVINVGDCRREHLFGEGVWNVVRQIDECEHIVSSSLHGLIISDMLCIPNRQMLLSDEVEGGGFKFRDYYSAFDTERSPLVLDGTEEVSTLVNSTFPPPPTLPEVTDKLEEAWNKMLDYLVQ